MNVLIACEESQAVCKEFRRLGHNAFSCDVQEWIPVEERLPEAEGDYLVASHNGKVDASLFFPEKELSSSYAREAVFCYPGVTHWMPLPEPPGKDVTADA